MKKIKHSLNGYIDKLSEEQRCKIRSVAIQVQTHTNLLTKAIGKDNKEDIKLWLDCLQESCGWLDDAVKGV